MKLSKQNMLLYAVTDCHWLKDETLVDQVRKALEGGATFIQLREKSLTGVELIEEAIAVRDLCREYHVPFVIDDNVELAKEIDADGVHLGQNDMSIAEARKILGDSKIIGATAKTVEQALKAQEESADYIGTGAAFVTSSKLDTWTIEHSMIRAIVDACDIPVIAIGGITYDNVSELKDTCVAGVAVISAIFGLEDITGGTKMLKEKVSDLFGGRKTALTIAGSDSSGGAGIQADIKTMISNGVYAMSAITALTAQNTTGVTGIMNVTPEFMEQQMDAVFTDIYPDAIKIGMVSASDLIKVISKKLQEYKAKNIVVDPVMVATSGAKLISDDAISTLKEELFPLATVLTPNIPEAEVLSGMSITNEDEMVEAAKVIGETYHAAVLLKGGHQINDANDLLYSDGEYKWFYGKRINNPNTHGTGCTLSSAIASNLAKGYDLNTSVDRAKKYISGALGAMLDLGKGSGPMDHGFDNNSQFVK